jgi:hypothetical protein
MLEFFLNWIAGRELSFVGLAVYGVWASPAIVNVWFYLFRSVSSKNRRAINHVLGFIASVSATILIYPISASAETDYLTLGLILFSVNIAILWTRFSSLEEPVETKGSLFNIALRVLVLFAAIVLGCTLRHSG